MKRDYPVASDFNIPQVLHPYFNHLQNALRQRDVEINEMRLRLQRLEGDSSNVDNIGTVQNYSDTSTRSTR